MLASEVWRKGSSAHLSGGPMVGEQSMMHVSDFHLESGCHNRCRGDCRVRVSVLFALPLLGVYTILISMSVCSHISVTYVNFTKFYHMLTVALVRSSPDDSAIRCGWHRFWHNAAGSYVSSNSPGGCTEGEMCYPLLPCYHCKNCSLTQEWLLCRCKLF